VILRFLAHVCSRRIERDVADGLEELCVTLDQAIVEPPLPEGATATPFLVVRTRVSGMKVLETAAQRLFSRAEKQMVVRAHQSVRNACPLASFDLHRKESQKRFAIVVVAKELAPIDCAAVHVIGLAGELDASG
jgi:hypothetical protein